MQKLAIAENAESDRALIEKVLEAQHVSVRLPVVRRVIKDTEVNDDKGKVLFSVKKNQMVVCDIVRTPVSFTTPLLLTKGTTECGQTKIASSFQGR